jgi:hypothetical protein
MTRVGKQPDLTRRSTRLREALLTTTTRLVVCLQVAGLDL